MLAVNFPFHFGLVVRSGSPDGSSSTYVTASSSRRVPLVAGASLDARGDV